MAGRTNDKKVEKVGQIFDYGSRVEGALKRYDEYGRLMTPKEAFRELSHAFHGKVGYLCSFIYAGCSPVYTC